MQDWLLRASKPTYTQKHSIRVKVRSASVSALTLLTVHAHQNFTRENKKSRQKEENYDYIFLSRVRSLLAQGLCLHMAPRKVSFQCSILVHQRNRTQGSRGKNTPVILLHVHATRFYTDAICMCMYVYACSVCWNQAMITKVQWPRDKIQKTKVKLQDIWRPGVRRSPPTVCNDETLFVPMGPPATETRTTRKSAKTTKTNEDRECFESTMLATVARASIIEPEICASAKQSVKRSMRMRLNGNRKHRAEKIDTKGKQCVLCEITARAMQVTTVIFTPREICTLLIENGRSTYPTKPQSCGAVANAT